MSGVITARKASAGWRGGEREVSPHVHTAPVWEALGGVRRPPCRHRERAPFWAKRLTPRMVQAAHLHCGSTPEGAVSPLPVWIASCQGFSPGLQTAQESSLRKTMQPIPKMWPVLREQPFLLECCEKAPTAQTPKVKIQE